MDEQTSLTPDASPDQRDSNAMEKLMAAQSSPEPTDEIVDHEQPEPTDDKKPEGAGEPAKSDPDPKGGDSGAKDEPKGEKETEIPEKKIPSLEEKKEDKKEGDYQEDEDDKKYNAEVDRVNLRKGASEASQKALTALKQKAKTSYRERKILAREFDEYKKSQGESKPLTKEVETELEELRNFKRTIDLENDPQFNEQFTGRINQYEQSAVGLLKEWGMRDSAVKYIQDNGGVLKFRSSQELMPPSIQKDGKPVTREQWWEEFFLPKISSSKREEIGDVLSQLRQLQRGKEEAVKSARSNKDVYLKQEQERNTQASQDWVKRVQDHSKVVLPKYGDIAVRKEIPKDATPEVKAQIERHNLRYEKAEKTTQKYLTQVTPENLTEAAIGAAAAEALQDENKEKDGIISERDKRILELETELSNIKNAGKTANRQAPADGKKEQSKSTINMTAEEAMTEHMKPKA